jgi:hypothetical protein
VLASEAAPGDGGRNVIARLAALDANTLRVEIDPAAFAEEPKAAATAAATATKTPTPAPLRARTPTMNMVIQHEDDIIAFSQEEDLYGAASLTGTHSIDPLGIAPLSILTPSTMPGIPTIEGALAPTPPGGISSIPAIPAPVDTGPPLDHLLPLEPLEPLAPFPELKLDEPEIMRGADPEQVLQANTAVTPKGTMVKMFEALDAATTSANAAKQLELLVKLATESARKERVDMVADIFYGIVKREDTVEEKSIKRQFSMSIRRLSTPSVLQCLVELLPRRRENYEQYMSVFEKSDEAGVEALVEALVAAPSIQDRRVFYDALLKLRSGIRTLMFMLGDPRWYVVRNAAELLGEMKSMEAEPDLTKLLQHRDDRVRTAAAAALAKLGGTAAVRGMRASLAGEAVREKVSEAMSPREGNSVDSLIRAVDREEDSRVQMAMLAALGQLGTPAAVDKLLEIARSDRKLLARSRPTPMRVAAVHALGDVKSNTAHSALQALLHDKEKAVRGAASWVIMGRRRENGQWPEENGGGAAAGDVD